MVKHKGTVASIPPLTSGGQKVYSNPQIFYFVTGISAAFFTVLFTGTGGAGICRENPDSYIFECSGSSDPSTDEDIIIPLSQNTDRLIVKTTQGFGHENTGSRTSVGIEIIDKDKPAFGITYIDDNQSIIKSSLYGLGVESYNREDIFISSNGEFYSENNSAVIIDNQGTANIDATVHKVIGKEAGILLKNSENVTSQITTTGQVQGEKHAGILVLGKGGELSLTANGRVTGKTGILSTGFTNSIITTTDTIIGKEDEGIYSNVTSTGSDLTINSHNVTGKFTGIITTNFGSGNTNIDTDGLISGELEHGIWAAHKGKNLNIKSNNVTGKIHGIHIDDTLAHGNITVNTTGTVTAGETGIYVDIDSPSYQTEVTVNHIIAGYQGVYAKHQKAGRILIAIKGDIEVRPTEFQLSSVDTENKARCISAKSDASCGIVEIDTRGDATVDVTGKIKPRENHPAPQISVDLTGVEGIARVNIRDSGRIYGQSVTRTGDSEITLDELIFSGNISSHQLDLANIGNNNSETAFIGFDKLIKQDAGNLNLSGKQTHGAFHSAEIYGGEINLNDTVFLLKDENSIISVMRNAKLNIIGTLGSDILGSVDNQGVVSIISKNTPSNNHRLKIDGSLTNRGVISMEDSFTGNRIVVQGDYIASNNNILKEDPELILEVVLDGDASPADKLIIQGDSSGHTAVEVVSSIKPGKKTIDGIPIIEVAGRSDGTFALSTGDYRNEAGKWELIGGAYSYTLEKSGKNWHLTSLENSDPSDSLDQIDGTTPTVPGQGETESPTKPFPLTVRIENPLESENSVEPSEPSTDSGDENQPELPKTQTKPKPSITEPDHTVPQKRKLQPGVAVAMAASEHAIFLNRFSSLHQRAQARHDDLFATALKTELQSSSWLSIDDSRANYDEKTTASRNDHNATKIGFGIDFASQPYITRYVIGLNGYLQKSGTKSKSKSGHGQINAQSYGIGATGTIYFENTYLDIQAGYNQLSSDLASKKLGAITQNQKGKSHVVSIETGHKINTMAAWSIIPQAQISYSKTSLDSFKDLKKNKFEFSDMNQMTIRLGAALENKISTRKGEAYIYGKANIYHDLMDTPSIRVAGTEFESDSKNTKAELTMGGEYRIKNTAARLYGEIELASDIGRLTDISQSAINIGTNISW